MASTSRKILLPSTEKQFLWRTTQVTFATMSAVKELKKNLSMRSHTIILYYQWLTSPYRYPIVSGFMPNSLFFLTRSESFPTYVTRWRALFTRNLQDKFWVFEIENLVINNRKRETTRFLQLDVTFGSSYRLNMRFIRWCWVNMQKV